MEIKDFKKQTEKELKDVQSQIEYLLLAEPNIKDKEVLLARLKRKRQKLRSKLSSYKGCLNNGKIFKGVKQKLGIEDGKNNN